LRRDQRRIASSGLFDQSWYVANNPDAPMFPGGALQHFMRKGASALRDPNPFFDAAFYSAQNPEARANPPVHYLRRGAAQGLRPSQEFDPAWYLASYPDVAAAGIEPLSHFLRLGRAEGRLPAEPDDFSTVDEAKLVCLKRPTPRETMALFVTHASGREVKPHVPPYLAALAREDVSTILIVAADKPEAFVSEGLSNLVDGLYLRQNGGYDFAAWAHVARDLDFSRANCLFLLNDSVVGPTTVAIPGPMNRHRHTVPEDFFRPERADRLGVNELARDIIVRGVRCERRHSGLDIVGVAGGDMVGDHLGQAVGDLGRHCDLLRAEPAQA
jgi:hypothetical protein